MSTSTPRPFEGFRVRKTRSSTDGSTGLDYSNVRVVDGDISSRIRSLLVSRHASYPPRTPSPSEEHLPPRDIVQTFDFSSARSIARQARSERTQMGRLSLPVAAFSNIGMAGDQLARRPSEPNKLHLNDNKVLSNDKSQSRGPPSALGEGDKLKFPRFVSLRETNPGETVAQSNLHLDEGKHRLGDDIQDALDRSPTWKEHQLIDDNYEPPRRPKTIKEHQLDDNIYDLSHSPRILDEGSDFHFPRLVLVDKPKHGETIVGSDIHPETAKVSQTNGEELSREDGGTFNSSQGDVNSRFPRAPSHDHPVESHKSGSNSPTRDLNSRTSSAGAQEVQRVRRISHELASIVAQSLSGIGSTSPTPRTRQQSDISVAPALELANQNHKKYSPSLLSGASRSSVRHSLLKSEVSSSQFVDTGLPVPPILTPVAVVPPTPSQSLARSIHEPSGAQSPKSLVGTPQHESSGDYWRNMSTTPGDVPGAFPQSPAAVGIASEGAKAFIEPSLDEKPPSPISVEVQREWGVRLSKASTLNANPISQHGTDVEEANRDQRSLSGLTTTKVSVKSSRKPSSHSMHSPQMKTMSPENSERFLNPANVPLPMDIPVPPVEVPSTDEDSLSSYSSGDDQISWQPQPGLITSPSALATVLSSKSVFADKSSSTGKLSETEPVGSRRVSWFRSLLSPTDYNEKYRSRLTAMPPRTPSRTKSDGLHRSSTAPSKPVVDLYVERDVAVGKVLDPRLSTPRQMITPGASQTFTKTIADLEYLLNEAMLVARLAVDKEDAPSILETAAALLKGRRKSSGADSVHESAQSLSPSESDSSEYDLQPQEIPVPHYMPVIHQPDEPSNKRNGEPAKEFSAPSLPKENEPKDGLVGSVGSNPLQKIMRSPEDNSGVTDGVERNISRMPTRPRKNIISEFHQSDNADRGSLIDHKVPPPPSRSRTLPIRTNSHEEDSKSTLAKRRINTTMIVSANSREINPDEEDPLLAPKGSGQPLTHVRTSKGAVTNTPKDPRREKTMLNAQKVHEYIKTMHEPPIQARGSSRRISSKTMPANRSRAGTTSALDAVHSNVLMTPSHTSSSLRSLDGPHDSEVEFTGRDFSDGYDIVDIGEVRDGIELTDLPVPDSTLPKRHISGRRMHDYHYMSDLKNKSYISLKDSRGFSLARSYRRQPIARDWSPAKKRFVASIACISTALVGILIGIYAGEVPSIQYYIVDFHHYTILGNVFFYIGLAIPTIYFWPLPLMHGRKPYTLAAMAIAMPLLFPQAVAVSSVRSPYLRYWRVGLLLPRAFMGFALGFANMNFKNTLMDLFGASLQSGNPHQEVVDEHDVRRHGGGMGIWLGIWTWCSLGSLGIGFLIGAAIINTLNPTWGFYVSIILIAVVLFLNVICPEVRRSAYRRSVVEVQTAEDGISRRLARGEVKMHRVQTGPTWWGQEVHHGMLLSQNMLRQPGFLVMAFYVAWIYAQIVLIIVLLGSLMSKYYFFKSPKVGASVTAVPIGVLLSVPFQKASLFSRARHDSPKTNTMTIGEKVHMSSHVIRRAIFTLVLPFAGMAYTVSSGGPPTPFIIPIIFAALIGFLSGLAIAECHGLIMENWDTSDLQPGMTGRPRGKSGDKSAMKRTNYSSFPRVSSAFAITQGLGYLLAAAATGVGGVAQRHLGQQSATGVMAAILLLLTFLLLGVLIRFKEVQIIPDSKKEAMERWKDARAASIVQKEQGAAAVEEPWRPVIIGNPTGMTRRMSILESGSLSRWSEIRRKNRLIDSWSLEAKHPNLAVLENLRAAVKEEEQKVVEEIRQGAEKVSQEAEKAWGQAKVALSRSNSRRSVRGSSTRSSEKHAGDLGGHVEVLKGWRSSSGRDSPVRLPSDEKRNNKKTEGRGSKRRISEVRRTMTP